MRLALWLVLGATATGCTRVRLTDNVDLTFDFSPLIGPSNLLHQPYVQGSEMDVYVDHSDDKKDLSGWSLRSLNTEIFSVDNPTFSKFNDNYFRVHCHAVSDGIAQLEVLDSSGKVQHRTTVEVGKPDRIELLAHGPMLVDRAELPALTTNPQVLAGGTATFLVRYYKGARLLNGNGALDVASTENVTAATPQSFLFEDRDWLQVTPLAEGNFAVPLRVGGDDITTLQLKSVPESAVDEVRILGKNESKAKKGDWLVALAQAYDTADQPIYGVEYDWELDGDTEPGEGDLYRYQYDPKEKHNIEARFGALDAVAQIHGEGFVDSSNNIGCATSGDPRTSLVSLVVIGVAMAFARRRRRVA